MLLSYISRYLSFLQLFRVLHSKVPVPEKRILSQRIHPNPLAPWQKLFVNAPLSSFYGSSLVSLEVFSLSTNLVDRAEIRAICHSVLFSPLFLYFFVLEFIAICSYLSLLDFPVFFSALYLVHPSILFYSSFCSLFCFLSLRLFTFIFWSPLLFSFQICYPFFSIFLLLYSSKPIVYVLYCSLNCLPGCHMTPDDNLVWAACSNVTIYVIAALPSYIKWSDN